MSERLAWPNKWPQENLPYWIKWGPLTGATELSGASWIMPDGLTQGDSSLSSEKVATVWISGGLPGQKYRVIAIATAVSGQVFARPVHLMIEP